MIAPVRTQLQLEHLEREPRPTNVLHPSEICSDGWCPRAAYHKLISPNEKPPVSFRQHLIFEHGHSTHRRWQRWLGAAGRLAGYWVCLRCESKFYAQGRPLCPICNSPQVRYDELPLGDPLRMIHGNTDGLLYLDETLLEVKTIGPGTIRMLAPKLYEANTFEAGGHSVFDLDRAWNAIRRPFPSHVRQGTIYTWCARLRKEYAHVDKIAFLYEAKHNNDAKEFVVQYDERNIAPILDKALAIANAVHGRGPIPMCRRGATLCADCAALEAK